MSYLLALFPALLCAGMMLGAMALALFAWTPLRRIPWIARHARRPARGARSRS